jgi:hypothetical protein
MEKGVNKDIKGYLGNLNTLSIYLKKAIKP